MGLFSKIYLSVDAIVSKILGIIAQSIHTDLPAHFDHGGSVWAIYRLSYM